MAVPVRADLIAQIAAFGARQVACWQRGIEVRRKELRSLTRSLPNAERLLEVRRQQLDNLADRLPQALRACAQIHHRNLSRFAGKLSPQLLQARLAHGREMVAAFANRGKRAQAIYLARRADRVRGVGQLLNALSYRGVLARGFALVRDGDGHPLRNAAAVSARMRLDIEFTDGRVGAVADGEGAPTAAAAKPRPRKSGGPGQGSLF
jgi:exodeoxyribonuclease VII large subunit